MEELLKSRKLRVTDFRLAVLDIFDQNKHAVSMEQIEASLGEFDRITLYRTIKSFIEKGIIHEIVMSGDIKKLALCDDSCESHDHAHHHQHVHFRCKKCEEVFCEDVDNFPNLGLSGFQIDSIEIQAQGICKNCA